MFLCSIRICDKMAPGSGGGYHCGRFVNYNERIELMFMAIKQINYLTRRNNP